MREIMFRGKRVDNGEWIYGSFLEVENRETKEKTCAIFEYYDDENDSEVLPDTVGQYIGLTDKNGKKIFEGDIVHMKGGCISGFGAVEFENGCFGIADTKRKRLYLLDDHSIYRIDGNIHDNPELVKGD